MNRDGSVGSRPVSQADLQSRRPLARHKDAQAFYDGAAGFALTARIQPEESKSECRIDRCLLLLLVLLITLPSILRSGVDVQLELDPVPSNRRAATFGQEAPEMDLGSILGRFRMSQRACRPLQRLMRGMREQNDAPGRRRTGNVRLLDRRHRMPR